MRECRETYYTYNREEKRYVERTFEQGKLLGYGIDYEIEDGCGCHFTTAIIELPDGMIINTPVVNVKLFPQREPSGADCITIETDDAEHFREQIRAYTAEGYSVSSTGCQYGRWFAILIKKVGGEDE